MTANRNYKDTVFRKLFNNQKNSLELYNAVKGTNYRDWSVITMNTLEDVIYRNMKNDISFLIHNFLVIIEHQSTINENMPVRMLMFLGRLYEKILNDRGNAIYGCKLEELPNPEFIVFYNGKDDFPREKTLKLSTAFKNKNGIKNVIDLEVRVININKGVNPELERRSKTLADYASFIAKVREYLKNHPLEEAIELAVKYCIDNDILKEFLLENASEVINVLTTEFDMDKAIEVARWEGKEEGIEKGRIEGIQEGRKEGKKESKNYVLELIAQGLSYEEIKKKIEEMP